MSKDFEYEEYTRVKNFWAEELSKEGLLLEEV